jgi:hypothetical protein
MGTLSSPLKRVISIILKDVKESNYSCREKRGGEGTGFEDPGPSVTFSRMIEQLISTVIDAPEMKSFSLIKGSKEEIWRGRRDSNSRPPA